MSIGAAMPSRHQTPDDMPVGGVEPALGQDAARELGRLAQPRDLGLAPPRASSAGRVGQKRADLGDEVVGVLGAGGERVRSAAPRGSSR